MEEKLWKMLYNLEDYLEYDETEMGKKLGEFINKLKKCNIKITSRLNQIDQWNNALANISSYNTARINKVTKEECLDAIEYLYGQGFIEDMSRDQKWAVEILLKKVANNYKLKLN